MSHDDVDTISYWLFRDGRLSHGNLLSAIEAILVEIVHECVVSEFGRVGGRVDAKPDATAEGEVVSSFFKVDDTR